MLASGREYSNQMPEIFYLYLKQLYFAEREIKFVCENAAKKNSPRMVNCYCLLVTVGVYKS